MTKLGVFAIWLFTSGAAACPQESELGQHPLAPARDGNIAIQEELDAARRSRTRAAYDLFIARHPNHPLAETARNERRALFGDPDR